MKFPRQSVRRIIMSVEMQVDVHGIHELQRKLDHLDQCIKTRVDEALDFEVSAMQTRARSLAPKRTGYLASTIFAERVREWTFKLGAKASYAAFVEFGTRFIQARRFLSRALELGILGLVQHVNRAIGDAIREASTS
jgi:HK97 gp10 family phage protein